MKAGEELTIEVTFDTDAFWGTISGSRKVTVVAK
jgi:hypothetical protein